MNLEAPVRVRPRAPYLNLATILEIAERAIQLFEIAGARLPYDGTRAMMAWMSNH